jgi:hypothetical protein
VVTVTEMSDDGQRGTADPVLDTWPVGEPDTAGVVEGLGVGVVEGAGLVVRVAVLPGAALDDGRSSHQTTNATRSTPTTNSRRRSQ